MFSCAEKYTLQTAHCALQPPSRPQPLAVVVGPAVQAVGLLGSLVLSVAGRSRGQVRDPLMKTNLGIVIYPKSQFILLQNFSVEVSSWEIFRQKMAKNAFWAKIKLPSGDVRSPILLLGRLLPLPGSQTRLRDPRSSHRGWERLKILPRSSTESDET